MDSVQLAGVALAALLSEKFHPGQLPGHRHPGGGLPQHHSSPPHRPEPDPGHGGHRIFYLVCGLSGAPAFWVGVSAHPGLLPHCPPHCLPAAKGSPSLAGALPSNRRRPGLGIHQLCGAGCGLSGRPAQLHPVPGPHLRPVRRPGRPGGPDELRRPAGGDQPHQLPPGPSAARPSRW